MTETGSPRYSTRQGPEIPTSSSYGQPWSGALTLSVTMTCTSCEAAAGG